MERNTWHQLLQIIIAILTALATSLTAQSCMKNKTAKEKKTFVHGLAEMPARHNDDVQLLLVDGTDTTRAAVICTHR